MKWINAGGCRVPAVKPGQTLSDWTDWTAAFCSLSSVTVSTKCTSFIWYYLNVAMGHALEWCDPVYPNNVFSCPEQLNRWPCHTHWWNQLVLVWCKISEKVPLCSLFISHITYLHSAVHWSHQVLRYGRRETQFCADSRHTPWSELRCTNTRPFSRDVISSG